MAIRLILAGVMTACALLSGRAFAQTHIRRANELGTLMDDLQMLRALTLERMLPMGAALQEMKSGRLRDMGEALKRPGARGIADAWAAAAREDDGEDMLGGEEASALEALFSAVEVTGRRQQEALYARCISQLGAREALARKTAGEKRKLYVTLGALAGLAVSVVLI